MFPNNLDSGHSGHMLVCYLLHAWLESRAFIYLLCRTGLKFNPRWIENEIHLFIYVLVMDTKKKIGLLVCFMWQSGRVCQ